MFQVLSLATSIERAAAELKIKASAMRHGKSAFAKIPVYSYSQNCAIDMTLLNPAFITVMVFWAMGSLPNIIHDTCNRITSPHELSADHRISLGQLNRL
jgi:hypothetical protein